MFNSCRRHYWQPTGKYESDRLTYPAEPVTLFKPGLFVSRHTKQHPRNKNNNGNKNWHTRSVRSASRFYSSVRFSLLTTVKIGGWFRGQNSFGEYQRLWLWSSRGWSLLHLTAFGWSLLACKTIVQLLCISKQYYYSTLTLNNSQSERLKIYFYWDLKSLPYSVCLKYYSVVSCVFLHSNRPTFISCLPELFANYSL